MRLEGQGFEEWDADFLDQLIQVEEFALSAPSATSKSNPNPSNDPSQFVQNFSFLPQVPPPPPPLPPPSLQLPLPDLLHGDILGYSPPRQLSHRSSGFNDKIDLRASLCSIFQENAKDIEINRLKRELEGVSKKLSELEDECFELRTSRFKRGKSCESQSRCINRHEADDQCLKNTNLDNDGDDRVPMVNPQDNIHKYRNRDVLNHSKGLDVDSNKMDHLDIPALSSSKAKTVQADEAGEMFMMELDDDPPSHIILSEKLRNIWGFPSNSKLGLGLMSKLLLTCSKDFHVLFGCMRTNLYSKKQIDCLFSEEPLASASSHGHVLSLQNSEVLKISHVYYVLTKINNGIFPIEALFGPLLGLCEVENWTLLRHNVNVDGHGCGKEEDKDMCIIWDEVYYSHARVGHSNNPMHLNMGIGKSDIPFSQSCVNWIAVFKLMKQISMVNSEEHVRLEAISIMNIILLRGDACLARNNFSQIPMFECISQLLKKQTGVRVQKEALHLLYLLLNCPEQLTVFCNSCDTSETTCAANSEMIPLTSDASNAVLQGLVDCVTASGHEIQDIELRKRTVILLALLASSGKRGFQILVDHKLLGVGDANFLTLILQMLGSEIDSELLEHHEARTQLVRETLILLNRLSSHPAYSSTALRILTGTRLAANLSVDIATALSRHDPQQPANLEIFDLARVFKKRIFAYLGDKIS